MVLLEVPRLLVVGLLQLRQEVGSGPELHWIVYFDFRSS